MSKNNQYCNLAPITSEEPCCDVNPKRMETISYDPKTGKVFNDKGDCIGTGVLDGMTLIITAENK